MYDLTKLGFSSFFQSQLSDSDHFVARVVAEHRGSYDVASQLGSGVAKLAGHLYLELDASDYPGVGDWVILKKAPTANDISIIECVLKRKTCFKRGAAGEHARTQIIAANIDIVFVVCGLDGDYNLRRIQRYVAMIWSSSAIPIVLLNKADLCNEKEKRVEEIERACPGVSVFAISALDSDGAKVVLQHLGEGITAAFVGSSGAGKSTLINVLIGEKWMKTGEVREDDSKGCHTTTHRQLLMLAMGGIVIDTPGMRELQLADDDGLEHVFPEIEVFAEKCRFRDCAHDDEPGCAVRQAVADGKLAEDRLDHYLKLEAEALSFEIRHDIRQRREAERVLSKRYRRDGKIIKRWKEGE